MAERSAFDDDPDTPMQVPAEPAPITLHEPHSPAVVGNEYSFAQTLAFHDGAVRSIASMKTGDMLMSGSIDFSNKMYQLNQTTGKYDFLKEVLIHEGFVMDICPMVTGTGFLSAGKDSRIVMIDVEGNPTMEYQGHEGAVNSLSQCLSHEFVSGSWDGTAKIWDVETGQCKETLGGHSHAVSVLTLQNGITITGSQDKKIRLWYNGKMEKEFLAHEDIVRGFTEVPNFNGFASCSNDEIVKLWTMDGTHMMDFKGHNGFIFSIDCLDTGEIITGGDDCTVKLWADGACKQTVQLPKTVWSVTHNAYGDIIVGTEDKKIRTFTRDLQRQDRESSDFTEYEEECKAAAQGGEKVDMSKLLDFKSQVEGKVRGKSDGYVQIFKEDGVAFAYMWSDAENKWNKIGEVQNPEMAAQQTGQAGAGGIGQTTYYPGDALFKAGEYDKVIDVDLGDGVFRKLPCDNGANYLEVADKFCSREGLGRSYTEQIVTFLRQNTLPYATRAKEEEKSDAELLASLGSLKKTCSKIPMRNLLHYEQVKLDGCKKKILEFNSQMNFFDERDLVYFESLCKILSATQNYHRTEVSPQQLTCINKLLDLPVDKAFPAMDLYRVYLCHPSSYEQFAASDAGAKYIEAMMRFLSEPQNPKALVMLTLRGLSNLFKNQSSQHVALQQRQKIIDAVVPHLSHPDKNVRQAGITLIMNYSVCFLRKDDPEGRAQAISALSASINEEKDLQNLLRSCFALGNLAHESAEGESLIQSIGIRIQDEANWEVGPNEPDADKNKQTIREIKAMIQEREE